MKKNLKSLFVPLLGLVFLIGFAACKSAPKQDAKPVSTEPTGLEKEAIAARNRALAVKADTLYSAEFAIAEGSLEAGRKAKTANTPEIADAAFTKAKNEYTTLANLTEAHATKEKIEKYNLVKYGQADFDKYLALSKESLEKYKTDSARSLAASQEALLHIKKAANAGFLALVKDARALADSRKKKCDSIKAERSMKSEYAAAVNSYEKAKQAAEKEEFEAAYDAYTVSANEFESLYIIAAQKKATAEEAMMQAKKSQAKSTELAREADKEAPLPADAKGFSPEPIDVSKETGKN